MLTTNHPTYIPIVLPHDAAALEQMPPQAALMISAVYGANPRLSSLVRNARERASMLLVDPKTPYFQFEGPLRVLCQFHGGDGPQCRYSGPFRGRLPAG